MLGDFHPKMMVLLRAATPGAELFLACLTREISLCMSSLWSLDRLLLSGSWAWMLRRSFGSRSVASLVRRVPNQWSI